MFQKDAISQIEPTGFWAIKSCEVDTAKSISRISMRVKKSTNQLCAMKLTDDKGESIVEVKWFNDTKAEWINRNVPAGQEIIGLYMSKSGDMEWIQSLGFIVWEPNHKIKD